MSRLRWLVPGIGVKRWILLTLTGVGLFGLGLASLLGLADPGLASPLRHALATLSPGQATLLLLVGLGTVGAGVAKLNHNVLRGLEHFHERTGYASAFLQGRLLQRGPRIVALGGGTGLSTILEGLKEHSSNLTAVVTVSDDGGSSGRLRKDLAMLPPGDIRNCLVALARRGPLLSGLLQHRFRRGEGLTGHSFGNLLIAALTEMTGSFIEAVRATSQVLAIAGEVLPSTCQNVVLGAVLEDGREIRGESSIPSAGSRIRRMFLEPQPVLPPHEVVDRLGAADLIVLGPGSLFTSVIPNLLVEGVADALNRAGPPIVYLANIMTQPGETDGFTLGDHVHALLDMTPLKRLDAVLLNDRPIGSVRLLNYERQGSVPVALEASFRSHFEVRVIEADLLSLDGLVRHDPRKTAAVLLGLITGHHDRAGHLA